MWGVKYNKSKGNKVWRLVVPSNYELNPKSFSLFLDKQSGEDSGFFIRKPSLWVKFVHNQEDKMRGGDRVKFILAECIGLQDQALVWGDSRDSERYIFDHHTILDSSGKKLLSVDCVLFAPLSTKKDAAPLLKTIWYYNLVQSEEFH